MKVKVQEQLLEQIDEILLQCDQIAGESTYFVNLDLRYGIQISSLCNSVISRIGGRSSTYFTEMERILQKTFKGSSHINEGTKAHALYGLLKSLRFDKEKGYLKSFEELIHGDIFGDFLEMAKYLLEEGYKDPAAVIAGSSLEAHLRQLCIKNKIDFTFENKKQEIINKKADRLNADLARDSIYGKLHQKNITAWLDIRNNAAHGEYEKYIHREVVLMVEGIRLFISQFPA